MFLFAKLSNKISSYLSEQDISLIVRAYLFAADAHETQYRSSGEPYITHPVATACILADMQMDHQTIIAALLHDVVEDTDVTAKDIETHFGLTVMALVEGVTKLTKIRFESRAMAQAENFRKMILAMVKDIRVILIKLADRLHNMRTLSALKPEKSRRIATETLEIYTPIANRLGMNNFKTDFQELGFKAIHPLRYRILSESVRRAKGNRRKLVDKIKQMLVERLQQEGLGKQDISGREKRLYSIYRKMQNKALPFSEIMDVYAFRIIAKDERTCYSLVGAVHSLFTPMPGHFKDYIAIPKANGYQSLHTTLFGPYGVPIEIQIRTKKMDELAENGIAAHWLYKTGGYASATEVKTRKWLQQLIDMQIRSGSSIEFIEDVKVDLFPDEVYVFTPTGDIKELPIHSTVVDFAYSVHTEVGNHCIAGKVNRRLVPLSKTINNGDHVEIITAKEAVPNPSWLNFVITGKAKSAIRHFLKSQKHEGLLALGKKLLSYSLSEYDQNWASLSQEVKTAIMTKLGADSEQALLKEIGMGERSSSLVAHQVLELMDAKPIEGSGEVKPMSIKGAEGIDMHFATCCYPIPGDDVRGVLSKGKGIEVHMSSCHVLEKMRFDHSPEAYVPLAWAKDMQGDFPVRIMIECENHKGVISTIAMMINKANINIREFNVEEFDDIYGIIDMVIEVGDRDQLAKLFKGLRKDKKILRVERYQT